MRPVPQRIELALLVQLHGDHHAVAHAFSARVVVGAVGHVSQGSVFIDPGLEIDALFLPIAMEQLLKCLLYPGAALSRRVPLLRKKVAGRMGLVPAAAGASDCYLIPITIEAGPIRCSTRVSLKPASFIQPMQSAPV